MSNNVDKDNNQLNEKDTNVSVNEEPKKENKGEDEPREIKVEEHTEEKEIEIIRKNMTKEEFERELEKENSSDEEDEEKDKEKEENEKAEDANEENNEKENSEGENTEDAKNKTPEEKREELKSKLSSGMKMQFKEGKGKFSFKGFVMLIFIITVLLSVPTMLSDVEKTPSKEISYTEFIKMSEDNKIVKVEEKEGYVYGYAEGNDNAFKTRMITERLGNDPKLVRILEKSDVNIKSVPPEELPFLVSLLMSWFPMLLLIGVWFFMLNRMNKGGGGGLKYLTWENQE